MSLSYRSTTLRYTYCWGNWIMVHWRSKFGWILWIPCPIRNPTNQWNGFCKINCRHDKRNFSERTCLRYERFLIKSPTKILGMCVLVTNAINRTDPFPGGVDPVPARPFIALVNDQCPCKHLSVFKF